MTLNKMKLLRRYSIIQNLLQSRKKMKKKTKKITKTIESYQVSLTFKTHRYTHTKTCFARRMTQYGATRPT